MQIQLLFIMVGELIFKELVHKVLVVLSDLLRNSLRIILACADIAYGETIEETSDKSAAPEHRIV